MSNKRLRSNRLIFEKSPYLLQHADNPVDWYPWIPEAFEKARNEDKPIFLSIGYSTCHWCHVMEKESFEDLEVARLLNDAFVCIKVDREERPDIDHIYMSICQLMTGSGGWPLTIIMTPDKQPFYAATYLPKESRYGRIGIKELIPHIIKLWKSNRTQIMSITEQVTSNLSSVDQSSTKDLDKEVFNAAFEQLSMTFDEQYGGFGNSPKFPIPHNLMFLLRYWKRSSNEKALRMVEKTLQAMMQGGIYDHLGFGFHRYSTDSQWIVPHFEKMLYDQALLAIIYTEAYQITKKKDYKRIVRDIFVYVLRNLYHLNGGFYSAEDADSEDEEGKFYLWSHDQIKRVLPSEEAKYFISSFNIKKEGNYRSETNEKPGKNNILYLQKPISRLAYDLSIPEQNLRKILKNATKKLFKIRRERVHPLKDDKILTDWNGLMLVALAKAAQIFSHKRYINAAAKTVDFIMKHLIDSKGRLYHRYRKGDTSIPAFLDDYAFLIWGLLELYEATFETSYLKTALSLTKDMITHFWDNQYHCFFLTADDVDTPLARTKKIYDGAIPSGNSVAMLDLLLLSRITADPQLEEKAMKMGRTLSNHILQSPASYTQLLLAVDFLIGPTYELIFVAKKNGDDLQTQLKKLRESFIPHKIMLFRSSSETSPEITRIAPFTQNLKSINGKSTIYVCKNYTCTLPTTDIKKVLDQLN